MNRGSKKPGPALAQVTENEAWARWFLDAYWKGAGDGTAAVDFDGPAYDALVTRLRQCRREAFADAAKMARAKAKAILVLGSGTSHDSTSAARAASLDDLAALLERMAS